MKTTSLCDYPLHVEPTKFLTKLISSIINWFKVECDLVHDKQPITTKTLKNNPFVKSFKSKAPPKNGRKPYKTKATYQKM